MHIAVVFFACVNYNPELTPWVLVKCDFPVSYLYYSGTDNTIVIQSYIIGTIYYSILIYMLSCVIYYLFILKNKEKGV